MSGPKPEEGALLGSQAMSGAERGWRYRQRLAELGKPAKPSEQ